MSPCNAILIILTFSENKLFTFCLNSEGSKNQKRTLTDCSKSHQKSMIIPYKDSPGLWGIPSVVALL